MNTKVSKAPVTSVDTRKTYSITAVGILCISDDIIKIKTDKILDSFRLKRSQIHHGKGSLDMLIGINHAFMHTGVTKQSGGLVTRNTPLGWVIFGSPPGKVSEAHKFYHVKFAMPVAGFWSTELMGVQGKSCLCEADKLSQVEQQEKIKIENLCEKVGNNWLIPYPWKKDPNQLPDNRSQAVKRLKVTKRQLIKNPELAAAYNKQMTKMN